MSVVFDETTGFPPPGRIRVSFDEAEAALVSDSRFVGSSTRPRLWQALELYLARFLELERQYAGALAGRTLIKALWLAGSFVSTKVSPNNIDMTVIVDGPTRDVLKGRPGAQWLAHAFSRAHIREELGISPLRLIYWPVVSVFRMNEVEPHQRDYLIGRGAWDDWWQRCRADGKPLHPTLDTVDVRRGYLEVVL